MNTWPIETEILLFGGPFDGKTHHLCGRPYELWMPVEMLIDPGCYCPVRQWAAIYTRIADKNQYQYLETRRV